MNLILTFLITLIISINAYGIDTKAEQAVVVDFDTNEILFEKNANQPILPSLSMTKIMTVYAAFDRLIRQIYLLKDTVYNIS